MQCLKIADNFEEWRNNVIICDINFMLDEVNAGKGGQTMRLWTNKISLNRSAKNVKLETKNFGTLCVFSRIPTRDYRFYVES